MSTETAAATPTTESEDPATVLEDVVTDWKAEAEKWKNLADTTDKRAKRLADESKANAAAARELEAFKQASMSDTEKAIANARYEARTEALRESGSRLVDAEVRAALANTGVNVKALLDGLDRTHFLDDNGEPDVDRINKWAEQIAPPSTPGVPRVPMGPRGPTTSKGGPSDDLANFIKGQLHN